VRSLWSQVKRVVSTWLGPPAKFLKYKRQILAVFVFLAIASGVVVVSYLDYRKPYVDVGHDQSEIGGISVDGQPMFQSQSHPIAKYCRVALESIDDIGGTVHLRADLHMMLKGLEGFGMPEGKEPLLFSVEESIQTDQIRKNPFPVQVLFGPVEISDASDEFMVSPSQYFRRRMDHLHISSHPPPNYSESAPASAQADVPFYGDPWQYPFDKYLIAARVMCPVLATPDQKQYFDILGDEYALSFKIPNLLVRNAKAKDVETWKKADWPDIPPKNLKEDAQSYRADVWRDGGILLVLERPLFPKFFAMFFGIVALAWIAIVAMSTDAEQLSLNALGYFLAIWAIRAPLAAEAPKGTILMDYVTLGLYALLVAVALAKFIWGFRKI
jgi:hypothetical protein